MRVRIVRDVAEWHRETWEVEIPDDTPEDEREDAASDAMSDGHADLLESRNVGNVEMLDAVEISREVVS